MSMGGIGGGGMQAITNTAHEISDGPTTNKLTDWPFDEITLYCMHILLYYIKDIIKILRSWAITFIVVLVSRIQTEQFGLTRRHM